MSRRAFWSTVVIALLALFAPALDQDDAAFFNYLNNVVEPHALHRPRDYALLPQELFTFSVRHLPFVVQVVLYRVPPLVVMLLLHRELRHLLDRHATRIESTALSLAVVAPVWWLDQSLWANVTLTPTSAFLTAAVHVVRVGSEARPYSPGGFAGLLATAASTPLTVILFPPLLYQLWQKRNRDRTRQLALIVSLGVMVYVSSSAAVAGVLVVPPIAEIPRLFAAGFETDYALYNRLVIAASAVLATGAAIAVWRRHDARSLVSTLSLVFIGLASVAAVLLTNRLAEDQGGFNQGHTMPVLLCALILVTQAMTAMDRGLRRATAIAGVFGLAVAVTAVTWRYERRGHLEVAFMKYRFLMVGQQFRGDCRDGDVMVFEEEDTSPVVLCRPQPLPIGDHVLSDFAPSVGQRNSDPEDDEKPVIRVFEPLVFPALRP